MRTRRIVVVGFLSIVAFSLFALTLSKYHTNLSFGLPVRLISASGSLEPTEGSMPFVHTTLRDDELHLVIRSWFYSGDPMATPYITVKKQGQGVLHIDVEPHFSIFASKCELFRQLEVTIPQKTLKHIETLQVFNENTQERVGAPLALIDAQKLADLLEVSRREVALESLVGVIRGC